MHLLIPFAAPLSDGGRHALTTLDLPQLAGLLSTAGAPALDSADETSLSPPHERALARALGLAGVDGCLPWAAWRAAQDGVNVASPHDLCWGLLTPGHWHLGTDHVTMLDPDELGLDEAASHALLEAVHDLFESEGFLLVYGAPTRWYLAHESLTHLAVASPDRVIGRNVDPWLPPSRDARLWRRLQNEVQMRLHTHPLNAAREAQGRLPVNSLWLSGCGVRQPATWPGDLVVDDRLRRSALAEDWASWLDAWGALDAGPVAALRGRSAKLTLCGERTAATWTLTPPGALQRLAARWRRTDMRALLEGL
ncbi:hypothetical protein [Rubrivivax albus]|uniref:Phosphoglycerate mutase n=1 Tax=Rubrivivax albus TaxID=2499835 RepID=A0A3S2X0S5_9BURK|nr:hypothetical protein [Rubrivivax albus]RVT51052.1 hypothetical protein ENE75_14820 [Rubrivivax albus]